MNLKFLLLAISVVVIVSCSSDDSDAPSDDGVKLVSTKVFTNASGGTNELRFSYNSQNNVARIDADTYYKSYSYSGDNIVKVESIDFPDSPYYTIDFMYDNSDKVVFTKRTNHYNNTIMIVVYEYVGDLITSCCIYSSQEQFDLGNCQTRYDMRYQSGRNFDEKDLVSVGGISDIIVETSKWTYDSNEKPYFGEAIEKINLPYATSGIEMDYEYVYNTNNPIRRDLTDNSGTTVLSRTFEYTYDSDGYPVSMIIKNYNRDTGELSSTVQNAFTYTVR